MSLPPPRLRDVQLIQATNSSENEKYEVWEIGVPAKRSLYWSVLLSYLISSDDNRFSELLSKIKNSQTAAKGKQVRRLLTRSCSANFRVIKKLLGSFNPFKNRHAFFYVSDIIEVFKAFKLKLNQYAGELKSANVEWSDKLKLKAASQLLNCKIEIYFPDEVQQTVLCYSSPTTEEKLPLIILFQYKNQEYGSRTEKINIFRFAMTTEYAHGLKLDALAHILKKAKLRTCDIGNIKQIMRSAETHGKHFLPTLLHSPNFHVLPDLYKSPYIALKLSESGFETNPADIIPHKPSPFLYAMIKPDTKYIRILYDYAVNCRFLFDKTVRDADESILESIEKIHKILQKDKAQMNKCGLKITEKEQSLNSEFSRFNELQQDVVTTVKDLKDKLRKTDQMLQSHSSKASRAKVDKDILNIHRQVILSILECYFKFFYFKTEETNSILDKYGNYLNFAEYYENVDYFSCLCFFDNIHLLKKVFQIKDEDLYANIESTFFLLIVSSKYFPKFKRDSQYQPGFDETECENSKNALRIIPLLYREALKTEMKNFMEKLKSEKSEKPLVPKCDINEEYFRKCLSSFPVIRDELLVARIKKYLKAASQISLEEDGIKCTFVIERALQIIGESIKPQSTKDCVVSCLLGSKLPQKIKKELICIRDELSHYKGTLIDGRLEIEQDSDFLDELQNEIETIQKSFEIVAFTQYLRLEEYFIEKGHEKLKNHQLGQNLMDSFLEDFKKRLIDRKRDYTAYHNECIQLSFDIINDLRIFISENSGAKPKGKKSCNLDIDRLLTSIEYVFLFMGKLINEKFFQPYLEEIHKIHQEYESKKELRSFQKSIECFFVKYTESVKENFTLHNFSSSLSQLPAIESFLKRIKSRYIDGSEIDLILKAVKSSYKEAEKAKDELKSYIENNCIDLTAKEDLLLKKLLISPGCLRKLRDFFKNKKTSQAKKELEKPWIPEEKLVKDIKKMLEDNSVEEGNAKILIIKLTNQRHLRRKIYTSVNLNQSLCNKLENVLLKKTQFFLGRIKDMKSILVDEDKEIIEVWNWGSSKGIKCHMKFLMRQRFLREMPVRAALEMALFDCLNILNDDFKKVYEKLNNLFTGINLRNVLSHGHSLLETTCGLVDEDDLPSELINKILDLIEDAEAIKSMLELIPCSDTLEKESFETWIEKNQDNDTFKDSVKKITGCQRWRSYLYLLPLM